MEILTVCFWHQKNKSDDQLEIYNRKDDQQNHNVFGQFFP